MGVAGGLAAGLALLAFVGWGTGAVILAAGRPGLIPMAPSTALLFLGLGLTLALWGRGRGPRTRWVPGAS